MSRLTDKYQSYSHYKGISFDETTFTADPTKTGSKLLNGSPVVMSAMTNDGANSPTIQTGVMPNQKYYELEFDSTTTPTKNSRLIYGNTTAGSAGGSDDIRRLMWDGAPFDRVVGMWVKTPSQFGVNGSIVAAMRWLYGTAAMINVGAGKQSDVPVIGIFHGNTELPTSSLNFYSSYTDQNSNVIPIEWNKWYFIAVKKSVVETGGGGSVGDTMTGTLEYKHYINGELVNTVSTGTWTKRSVNGLVFGNNAAAVNTGAYKVGISSFFVADWTDITQTGLREIYNYGAPIQAPVKHYNGTAWVDDASAPKVYYNGAWQDVYASRWTGTAWVAL